MKKYILKVLGVLVALALIYNAGGDAATYVLSKQAEKRARAEILEGVKESGFEGTPYIYIYGCFYSTDAWFCDVAAGPDEESATRFAAPLTAPGQ